MKVAIPGGTGLIGKRLAERLVQERHEPVILTRNPETASKVLKKYEIRKWDPAIPGTGDDAFQGADAVVNLAGEPISSGRWTQARKQRIYDSRVLGTARIVEILAGLKKKPKVFIAGSAVGYYGARGNDILAEEDPPGKGFAATVCHELEQEASRAVAQDVRVVQLRTGVVLSRSGGALVKMLLPFKWGLGGRIGNGRQWFPWIHEADMAGIILHILNTASLAGPINATAPEPVTNSDFTRALGQALCRPTFIPLPVFALKLLFGEMSSILFASQRVLPQRLIQGGFRFRYEKLDQALRHLFKGGAA